jgi:hypothetical protein
MLFACERVKRLVAQTGPCLVQSASQRLHRFANVVWRHRGSRGRHLGTPRPGNVHTHTHTHTAANHDA